MNYALKTPDNQSLFLDHYGHPLFVANPAVPSEFWPVDATIPAGSRQTGWALVAGVCTATSEVIPLPTAEDTARRVWFEKLSGRITDPVTKIEIEASEPVRNLLTGQLTMMSVAISVGAMPANTPQDIWDANGVKHTFPADELIGLILRHGAAWGAMFAQYAP